MHQPPPLPQQPHRLKGRLRPGAPVQGCTRPCRQPRHHGRPRLHVCGIRDTTNVATRERLGIGLAAWPSAARFHRGQHLVHDRKAAQVTLTSALDVSLPPARVQGGSVAKCRCLASAPCVGPHFVIFHAPPRRALAEESSPEQPAAHQAPHHRHVLQIFGGLRWVSSQMSTWGCMRCVAQVARSVDKFTA